MAFVDARSGPGLWMNTNVFFLPPQGEAVSATPVHTATRKQELRSLYETNWYGSGFTYSGPDANGLYHLTGGTVTSMDVRLAATGALLTTVTGLNADLSLYQNDAQFIPLMLAGDDTILVGDRGYILRGHDGNDILVCAGSGPVFLEGGAGNDLLLGGSSIDTLQGGAGIDTMRGGDGNDDYYVREAGDVVEENVDGGTDRVFSTARSYVMADHLEVGWIWARQDSDLTGNARDNILHAGDGNNVIDGGGGTDHVFLSTSGAVTVDLRITTPQAMGNGSMDTLLNVEGITSGAGDDHLTGNAADNLLDGARGADTMIGGDGDDTYRVDVSGDVVDETASLGTDQVISGVDFRLGTRMENLTLQGTADYGYGNGLDNEIRAGDRSALLTGGAGADTLVGGIGFDTLRGSAGDDVLTGGAARDQFAFNVPLARAGIDTLTDFTPATPAGSGDRIVLDRDIFPNLGVLREEVFRRGTAAQDDSDRIIYDPATGALFFDVDGTGAQAQVQFAIVGVGTHPELTWVDFLFVR